MRFPPCVLQGREGNRAVTAHQSHSDEVVSKRRKKPSLYGAIISLFNATSFKTIKAKRAVHGRQAVACLSAAVWSPSTLRKGIISNDEFLDLRTFRII